MDELLDLSSPKTIIVVNTLVAVVATAICSRALLWWKGRHEKPVIRTGRFVLKQKDFGDEAETRRDVCRTFQAGSIHVQCDGGDTFALRPPPGLASGVDREAVEQHNSAFLDALRKSLPQLEISSEVFKRILPMLTVNPAFNALQAAGELPMLKNNRFLIKAATGDGDSRYLHILTIGFVAPPPGPNASAAGDEHVLTVASPDLLRALPTASALTYELTYALRRKSCTLLEEELLVDGVVDVPVA